MREREKTGPRQFEDAEGRAWNVRLTVESLRRVRALTGRDVGRLAQGELAAVGELVLDPMALADVLFALCKPEADAQGVTTEQFGAALAGDAIEDAAFALVDAFVDFCPSRLRPALREWAAAARRASDQAAAAISAAAKTLAEESSNSASASPASADSTPAP